MCILYVSLMLNVICRLSSKILPFIVQSVVKKYVLHVDSLTVSLYASRFGRKFILTELCLCQLQVCTMLSIKLTKNSLLKFLKGS